MVTLTVDGVVMAIARSVDAAESADVMARALACLVDAAWHDGALYDRCHDLGRGRDFAWVGEGAGPATLSWADACPVTLRSAS